MWVLKSKWGPQHTLHSGLLNSMKFVSSSAWTAKIVFLQDDQIGMLFFPVILHSVLNRIVTKYKNKTGVVSAFPFNQIAVTFVPSVNFAVVYRILGELTGQNECLH